MNLEDELEDELKVCCGPTDDVLEHMRKTLSLMKQRSDATSSKDGTYERLAAELDKHLGLGTSPAVGYVYLYHLAELDLIEHGCGIHGSWPTQAGLQVLTKLEAWLPNASSRNRRPECNGSLRRAVRVSCGRTLVRRDAPI